MFQRFFQEHVMGNKVLNSSYKLEKTPSCEGLDVRWTCCPATHTDRPTEPLTVFLFEKKLLDKNRQKDAVLECLRRDAQMLQRLRHPNILHVLEPLVEEKLTLAFATRHVKTNLATLLEKNAKELTALEMKCGLLDLAEAIRFLHQDAKTAHLGVQPCNIFVSEQGRWFLGGFSYAQQGITKGTAVDTTFGFLADDITQMGADPSLKYCAPEITAQRKFGLESDVFSLGLIAYEVMSLGEKRPLLAALGRYDRNGHQSKLQQLLPLKDLHAKVPPELVSILCGMLAPNPEHRIDISAFLQSEFFQDIHIKALRFLETLSEKDDAQKAQFLKGFKNLLEQPASALTADRILRERVLPQLVRALNYPPLYGHVLQCILVCLKRPNLLTPEQFQEKVWPGMRALFSAKEIPIEAVTDLIRNLDLIMQLTATSEANAILLPFLLRCLELPEPTIAQTALEKIPQLHEKFEYRHIKDQILPRMLAVLLRNESTLKARVQILMGINAMFAVFDRSTILETILTACERVQKMERAPALCMVLLSTYDAMSKFLGPRETATKILPLVCPLLAEESLTADQYRTQMEVCRKLLERVDTSRSKEYATRTDNSADVNAALGGMGSAGGLLTANEGGTTAKPRVPDADDNFLAELGGATPTGGPTGGGGFGTTSNNPWATTSSNAASTTVTNSKASSDAKSDFDLLLSGPTVPSTSNNFAKTSSRTSGSGGSLLDDGFGNMMNTTSNNSNPGSTSNMLDLFSTSGPPVSTTSSMPISKPPSNPSIPMQLPIPGSGPAASSAARQDDLLSMMGTTTTTTSTGAGGINMSGTTSSANPLAQLNDPGFYNSSGVMTGTSAATSSTLTGGLQSFDLQKTGVSSQWVGMANMQGDPFAGLGSAGGSASTGGMNSSTSSSGGMQLPGAAGGAGNVNPMMGGMGGGANNLMMNMSPMGGMMPGGGQQQQNPMMNMNPSGNPMMNMGNNQNQANSQFSPFPRTNNDPFAGLM
ncbi:unnamed protein product [Amoebophrya sp. A120]|nr:unnamed protein product [Amoebophrya sp. A120]|eukprot:GSA120T00006065001.1